MSSESSGMSDSLVRAWYQGAWWLYLLFPLSLLYSLIVRLRCLFFRIGLVRSYRSRLPVVVVGNITLGGTGKSPLVSYLIKSLQARGHRPGIVSRGYGARIPSDQTIEVLATSQPGEVGDEPLMLKRRLDCPVFVSPNRELSIQALEAQGCDIVIADDGLQHYAMARDMEICVFDGERKAGNGYVLPQGPLREPLKRARNVDAIVINGGGWDATGALVTSAPTYDMQLVPGAFIGLNGENMQALPEQAHAVAAIGNPARFFDTLIKMGIRIESHAFDDHHAFQRDDFNFIGDAPILMTEKDAVKCRNLNLNNAWYLPVEAELKPDLVDAVLSKLKQKGYFNG